MEWGAGTLRQDCLHGNEKATSECWIQFIGAMQTLLRADRTSGITLDDFDTHIWSQLRYASDTFESMSKTSTFSMAIILSAFRAKSTSAFRRWVLSTSISNSGIVLLKNDSGHALALQSFADSRLRNIEIGGDVRGAELQLHEVQAGDLPRYALGSQTVQSIIWSSLSPWRMLVV